MTFTDEVLTAIKRFFLKILWTVQSRKFWVGFFTIAFLLKGIEDNPNEMADELLKAIGTIVTAITYLVTTAWEDVNRG